MQAFEEAEWGVLDVGRRADLTWVEGDPHTVPAADWPGLAVLGTWLGGRRTFDATG